MARKITFFKSDSKDKARQNVDYGETIQKFVDDRGIAIAVRVSNTMVFQANRGYDSCDGVDVVDGQNLPYEEGIQNFVNRKGIIIAVRPINPMAFQLISEGYDTKKLALKAKSSIEGVTAGFIMEEPLFGKGGKKDAVAQAARIQKSLRAQCGRVPLNISDDRVCMLANDKFIFIEDEWEEAGIKIKHIKSIYDGDSYDFELRQSKDGANFWEVWRDKRPLMALTNPGQTGKKAAVTADYDLFAIYLPKNQSVVERAITVYPSLKAGAGTSLRRRWQHCIDSKIHKTHTLMEIDPEQGNISIPEIKIIKELNDAIKQAGYQGESLIWHGTETANPNTPGPDFPIRVYLPGEEQPLMVCNIKELCDFYESLQSSFYMEKNARFSFRA